MENSGITSSRHLTPRMFKYEEGHETGIQGLYSLSGKTSYRQILWSLEATRLNVIIGVSLWNLTGTSAAALPMCLLNFRAIGKVQTRISRLRDFTRSCSKTSYRSVNRGPGSQRRDYPVWYCKLNLLCTLKNSRYIYIYISNISLVNLLYLSNFRNCADVVIPPVLIPTQ